VRDRGLVAAYARAGVRVEGLRAEITSAVALGALDVAGSVRLRVRDRLSGYDLVGTDGRRMHRAARGPRSWLIDLRQLSGEWRFWDVRADGGQA
jgi:hypothetical protein